MKIKVYIATTNGPVAVQQITQEDPELKSVICLNGTAKALPISRAYDNFVREPIGVIERSFSHAAFRLDVSAPITDGNSWQLGTFLAHALHAEDQLAGHDDPVDEILWLSGEVDRNLNIRPVDHIEDKLMASMALFDQARTENTRLRIFIPSGPGLIPDDEVLDRAGIDGDLLSLEGILNVERILRALDLKAQTQPQDDEEDDLPALNDQGEIDLYADASEDAAPIKDNRLMRFVVLGGAICALLGGLYLQFADNLRALRNNSLKLGITELRAHMDHGCQKPERFPIAREGSHFPSSDLKGLCALEITLNNMGAPAYLWVFAQRLSDGHYLLADREGLINSEQQQGVIGWRMIVPTSLKNSIDYRIVALAADQPLRDPVNRMLRRSFGDTHLDWEKIKAQLVEDGISVVSVLHSLEQ